MSHNDPAIGGFLALLAKDIALDQNITSLPDNLAKSMLDTASEKVNLDDEIEGDVAL